VRKIKQIWQDLIRRFSGRAKPLALAPAGESAPVPDEQADLRANMAGLNSVLEQFRHQDEQKLEDLRQRICQLESERDTAHHELEALREAVADAVSRQDKAEIHTNNQEIRLRELSKKHQAALQEALILERRQARRLNVAMTVAVMAFVLAIMLSITTFRVVQNSTLASATGSTEQVPRKIPAGGAGGQKTESPGPELTLPELDIVASGSLPLSGDEADVQQADPPGPEFTLPVPNFVASGSLPLSGHDFSSRKDARAFFEENAQQPGVVALPSGLQYRALIPGSGRTPGSGDTVTIEYRALRPDGTELDNSFRETQPLTFVVAEASPGLREALQHMQEGAQWELYVPTALVRNGVRKRGQFGFEPRIYVVELLSINLKTTRDE
jgi:hypothetical protein